MSDAAMAYRPDSLVVTRVIGTVGAVDRVCMLLEVCPMFDVRCSIGIALVRLFDWYYAFEG